LAVTAIFSRKVSANTGHEGMLPHLMTASLVVKGEASTS
jgi:hypothetical protein